MSDEASDPQDLEQRLDDLRARASALYEKCHTRSALALAREARLLAKREEKLIPYLYAGFDILNYSNHLLQPKLRIETALEIISLLESEDRARTIEPNLPEAEYEETKAWMTACGYDNLANGMGSNRGYNSDGMHACIADGMQVCRRTGKLECITCFREYAGIVYAATDDLEMALHFARLAEANKNNGPHDRRWVGALDQVRLNLLLGDFDTAVDDGIRALELADTFHTPVSARLKSLCRLQTALLVTGRQDEFRRLANASDEAADGFASIVFPPEGEDLELELERDRALAVEACLAGQFDRACELLKQWDIVLLRQGELHEWFDVRLRLAAVCRMSDRDDEFERLLSDLQLRATEARDWLTIRRLNRLRDKSAPVGPLATAGGAGPAVSAALAGGTHATVPESSVPESNELENGESENDGSEDEGPDPAGVEQPETTRLTEAVFNLLEQLPSPDDENLSAGTEAVLRELMALASVAPTDREAGLLLYAARTCAGASTGLSGDLWNWAQQIAAPFTNNGNVISLLASVADTLAAAAEETAPVAIASEDVEKLHRTAMDLEPNATGVFSRAGWHYVLRENEGEAERCFSRSFRLDRTNEFSVLQLARIYQQSNRDSDALAAFDLALREGCESIDVAWQAAMAALDEGQYLSCLLYVDKYESLQSGLPWVSYFKALALLELERFDEAQAAAEEEHSRCAEHAWGADVLSTCAAAGTNRVGEANALLAAVLRADWGEIDYLTPRGLARLLDLLWRTTAKLEPALGSLAADLENRLLAAGLTPDALFERARSAGEKVPDVNFYRCTLQQPLDETWPASSARLNGQSDWQSYTITWGVLAHSEEEAARMALDWQSRCYPEEAVVESVDLQGSGYVDVPGVVWQGLREESPS
jgi:tetratricopeptide (TPR) repeat protein